MTESARPRVGRLCMVLHGGYPTEVRVAAETRAAVEAGYDVDVVSLLRPGQARSELLDGVRVYRLPIEHVHGRGGVGTVLEYLGFTLAATLKVARLSARRPYDIVQIHNPPDFLALAAVLPKIRGARVIFDVHDLAPDMFQMRFEGKRGAGLADKLLRWIERSVAKSSDAVLTVHEPYRAELGARGIDRDKIVVVLNTVPEDLVPPAASDSGSSVFRVVYHGTVTPHYCVETLVEAIAIAAPVIPELILDIYGEGDSLVGIRRRIESPGLSSIVRLHPPMSQRDVLAAVTGASVGVVPNLPIRLNRFALSTKLFEYVALGIPVVSSDLPTIRAHFADEEVSFVRAGDASALASALIDVHRDPVGAELRASAAQVRYTEYRWPVQARRYQSLLRSFGSTSDSG